MEMKAAEALLLIDNDHDRNKTENFTSKLQQRDQTRLKEAELKKNIREEEKVTEEKSSFFVAHFQEEVQNLYNMLKCEGLSKENRTLLIEHFDAITASYQRLQKFFNDSVMFLPKYDSKTAKAQISELFAKIEEKRAEMLPKKRFAFKSKSKAAVGSTIQSKDNISQLKEAAAKKYATAVMELKDDHSIQDRSNETLTLDHNDVFKKDVSLTHLSFCKVYIYGSPGTVHITDAYKCTFVIGPVSGSVFVERCSDSVIATGCQQLRVHRTEKTDFYLHVTSRAIIEDARELRFAPYNVQYPLLNKHFALSGLDHGINNWSDVDDFNWLATGTPSPNWKVLEEEFRKTD